MNKFLHFYCTVRGVANDSIPHAFVFALFGLYIWFVTDYHSIIILYLSLFVLTTYVISFIENCWCFTFWQDPFNIYSIRWTRSSKTGFCNVCIWRFVGTDVYSSERVTSSGIKVSQGQTFQVLCPRPVISRTVDVHSRPPKGVTRKATSVFSSVSDGEGAPLLPKRVDLHSCDDEVWKLFFGKICCLWQNYSIISCKMSSTSPINIAAFCDQRCDVIEFRSCRRCSIY